jgi:dipeptidase E
MRLVLLSSLTESLDRDLEKRIKQIVSEKGSRNLGYIPSQFDPERVYFQKMWPNLERLGFRSFSYCDIDKEHDPVHMERLRNCDAIFLSGGNTYYFLKNLQQRGFVPFLRDFSAIGGILIGVSAGAMVMSPTIDVAGIIDPNDVQLKDTSAFDLAQLHILPHYSSDLHEDALTNFSKTVDQPVFGCKDNSGIILEDNRIKAYGDVVKIK